MHKHIILITQLSDLKNVCHNFITEGAEDTWYPHGHNKDKQENVD